MLWKYFKKITEQADDFYHTSQIEEFFVWLHSNVPSKDEELVFINFPLQQELVDSQIRKKVSYESKSTVAFVLCEPGQLNSSLKVIDCVKVEKTWHLVFYASGIEIWENALRHGEILPLRFGLEEAEKRGILSFARECMEEYFRDTTADNNGHYISSMLERGEKVIVDVALWINGQLRGSIIIGNRPLHEGVRLASLGTLRDKRMKPVESHELARAQIEVTIFSSLRLPLRRSDCNDFNIDGRRGYYVASGGRHGWYIPAVFNCLKFKGMEHFRESLVVEKAKISRDAKDGISLFTFIVEGFIEEKGGGMLFLDGAVAYRKADAEYPPQLFIEEVRASGDRAAEWLLSMQDEDGFMPLYADPIHSSFGRMDWVRLACAAHALSCYGKVIGSEKFLNGAQHTFDYLLRHLLEVSTLSISMNDRIATLVYLARAAMSMKEDTALRGIMSQILLDWQNIRYEPVLSANMATLFILHTTTNNQILSQEGIRLAAQVFNDFKTRLEAGHNIQLAQYPELVHALELLHQLTGEDIYADKAGLVRDWFLAKQFEDGAFPSHTHSLFAYSRGTGKIFEVLAGTPNTHEKALKCSFRWLLQMQYGEYNTYFIKPEFRNRIIGGLRHDHANPEAWIDAVAHFLLGIARILSNRHDPEVGL